jgi:hypothetical protein
MFSKVLYIHFATAWAFLRQSLRRGAFSQSESDGGIDGMATPADIARRTSDPMHRVKTIGLIGGIALLTNNITGPGMIGTHTVHAAIIISSPMHHALLPLRMALHLWRSQRRSRTGP